MAVDTIVMCGVPTKKLTSFMFSYLQIFCTCLPICGQTNVFSPIQNSLTVSYRLNMELDLQSLFGLHVT
jgi:hypothetical protein